MAGEVFANDDMTEPTPAELGMDVGDDGGAVDPDGGAELDDGGDAGEDDGGAGAVEQVAQQRGGGRRPSVPLPEVQKLRAQLKAYEEERASLMADREAKIRFEERFNLMRAQQEQAARQAQAAREAEAARQAAEADPMPDKELDPEAFNEWRIRQLERQVMAQREDAQTWQRQAAQREQENHRAAVVSNVARDYTSFENAFATTYPDYIAARTHVANWYAGFFRARGVPEQEIPARIERERALMIADCVVMTGNPAQPYVWKPGMDPAAIIYQTAYQLGYVPAGMQQDQGDEMGEDGGQQQAAVPARPVSPRGRQLAQSVGAAQRSGAPGRAGASSRGKMTLAEINELPDSEFAKLLENEEAMMRHLMGG